MAWCEECDALVEDEDLGEEGECPTCGTILAEQERPPIPWYFKAMLVASVDLPRLPRLPGRDLDRRPRVASLAMPIYELDGVAPRIHADAFVHPDAVVIGDVIIGPSRASGPAPCCAATSARSPSGAGTSIQDGTVIHAGPGFPTIIGDGCVVGHLTHLEGCILEDESLAGSGSVVLHWAVIGRGATVGANAVVPNNMVVPPGALALGVPAKIFEGRSDVPMIRLSAAEYVANAKRYRASLRRLD